MFSKKYFLIIFTTITLASYQASAQQIGGNRGAVSVFATPVQIQDFADRIEALGTTLSNDSINVTADTSEKITHIHFQDGQFVEAGTLLVELNKSEEQAQLQSARAQLSEAQSAYDRARGLQENNALSRAALQERLATLRQREAEIEAIQARIDNRTITAPFDGILGLRQASVGTLVQPGDTITTLDDISIIKVDFDIPSLFLGSVQPGSRITGRVGAFPDTVFEGEVSSLSTRVDPVTRTLTARAIMPNPDSLLKPGLLMNINLLQNERKTLVVREEALIKRSNRNFVYMVQEQDGKTIAVEREVRIGSRMPGIVEILDGVDVGDLVVGHGTVKLADGMEIEVSAVEEEDTPLNELLQQRLQSQERQKNQDTDMDNGVIGE